MADDDYFDRFDSFSREKGLALIRETRRRLEENGSDKDDPLRVAVEAAARLRRFALPAPSRPGNSDLPGAVDFCRSVLPGRAPSAPASARRLPDWQEDLERLRRKPATDEDDDTDATEDGDDDFADIFEEKG